MATLRPVNAPRRSIGERLDEVVFTFFPKWGAKRKAYREANRLLRRFAFSSYKGASKDRLRSGWTPGGGSPDEDLLPELGDLRERSRDLNRNDATAAGITQTVVVNDIGAGIRPQSRIDQESLQVSNEQATNFQRRAERAWQRWVPFADSSERMSFYEIQSLVDRQILENGEAVLLPLMLDLPGRPYRLALEVVEADKLDTPADKVFDKSIRKGVEIGKRGEPVAYWIRKLHPGGVFYRPMKSDGYTRVPAKNEAGRRSIFHLYHVLRPGQTRGVPFFAPVLTFFKDLASYMEAEVVSARIAACFSIFITSADSYGLAEKHKDRTSDSQRIEKIEPGMIRYLQDGENISSFAPNRPGATFEPFVETMLRMISAALGLCYEIVAKDFSKVNYSSARAALLEARRYFQYRQEWLARRLCQPVWEMVLEEAYLRGELGIHGFYGQRLDWVRARWIAPGWPWVDPVKEVKAARNAVESNLSSLADEAAAHGKDWEEVMEQRARERQKREELGLPEPPAAGKGVRASDDLEDKMEEVLDAVSQ